MGTKNSKWDVFMECARKAEQPFSSDTVMNYLMDRNLDREYTIFQVRRCLSLLVMKGELEYAGEGWDGYKHSRFIRYRVKGGIQDGVGKSEGEHVRVGDAHLVDTTRQMPA